MPKTKILVDTHYLIWDMQGHPNFDSNIEAIITDHENEIYFCSISFWEIAMLHGKKRIQINQPVDVFCNDLQAWRNYKIIDISPNIAEIISRYADQINGDPADRIIAATAISKKAFLLTRDKNLRSLSFINTI